MYDAYIISLALYGIVCGFVTWSILIRVAAAHDNSSSLPAHSDHPSIPFSLDHPPSCVTRRSTDRPTMIHVDHACLSLDFKHHPDSDPLLLLLLAHDLSSLPSQEPRSETLDRGQSVRVMTRPKPHVLPIPSGPLMPSFRSPVGVLSSVSSFET